MRHLQCLIEAVSEDSAFRVFHERYNPGVPVPPYRRKGRVNRDGTPLRFTGWKFAPAVRALILRHCRTPQGDRISVSSISKMLGTSPQTVCDLFNRIDAAELELARNITFERTTTDGTSQKS